MWCNGSPDRTTADGGMTKIDDRRRKNGAELIKRRAEDANEGWQAGLMRAGGGRRGVPRRAEQCVCVFVCVCVSYCVVRRLVLSWLSVMCVNAWRSVLCMSVFSVLCLSVGKTDRGARAGDALRLLERTVHEMQLTALVRRACNIIRMSSPTSAVRRRVRLRT